MRFILVTRDFPPTSPGGVAAWASDLAQALHEAEHTVVVLARKDGDTRAEDNLTPFPIVRMQGRSWARWQRVWTAPHLWRHVRRGDVVLASTWEPVEGLHGFLARRGARLVVGVHGSDVTALSSAPPAMHATFAAADAVVCASGFLRRELDRLGLPSTKAQVLPMPLVLPDLHAMGRAEKPEHLLVVARLTPLKGVERAMRLAQALDMRLVVVGSGPEGERLRAEATPLVRFVGAMPRERLGPFYAKARAALLLSDTDSDGLRAEGLGLSLLEAASYGAPAIGSHVGGIPEAVGPGLVLADPDNPDLDAVRAFLADPAAGAHARAWVEAHHGPQKAVHALLQALA